MHQRTPTPVKLFPGPETGDVEGTFVDIERLNL